MKKYDGYVALDLGNTNSTLVCLHANTHGHASDVEVVKVEHVAEPGPIPSAVFLTSFVPPPRKTPTTWNRPTA